MIKMCGVNIRSALDVNSGRLLSRAVTAFAVRCGEGFHEERRKQAGQASIVAAIAVLVIGGLIAVASLQGYNLAMRHYNTQKMTTQMQTIVVSVRDLYSGRAGYGTANMNALLISSNRAPVDAVAGTSLVNPFGGTWTVVGNTATFSITATNLPAESCISMAKAGGGGATAIKVNGTALTLNASGVDPADAAANCAAATNTVEWIYS